MSVHTEITNEQIKNHLEDLCNDRWNKMKNPCKSCKYRCPIDDGVSCCIFPSVPRDWSRLEK